MRRAEAEALRKLDPEQRGIAAEEIRLGDWIVERTCPHRHADLAVFGEIDGCELVCTLHGWRFDLETGRCLTADNRELASVAPGNADYLLVHPHGGVQGDQVLVPDHVHRHRAEADAAV